MASIPTAAARLDEPAAKAIACRQLYLAAAGLLGLAAAALAVDIPAARYFRPDESHFRVPGDLRKAIMLSEVFGHGAGVGAILLTIFVLNPQRRRALFRIAACAFASGYSANLVKLTIGRTRPNGWELDGNVWASFTGWIPSMAMNIAGTASRTVVQSFPSGHTATAVGLAIGLGWLYPRGRWLFAGFAVLTALQRVIAGAHYPSDTLAAAALACVVAGLCLDDRWLGRFFDRWERRES